MKTWFITGASRGLGLETACAALAAGDQVVATGRDPKGILASLGDHTERALIVTLDVTDAASIQSAIEAANRRFDRIDVLVNNAR
jgi:NAD(P)-dependent dehydrogenase (short-subunit alcohol dehydrogenase family)